MIMILNVLGCLFIFKSVKKVLDYTDYSVTQSVPVSEKYNKIEYLSHTR